jgi:hypothetical protein
MTEFTACLSSKRANVQHTVLNEGSVKRYVDHSIYTSAKKSRKSHKYFS